MYRLSRRPVTARIQAMCIAEVSNAKSARVASGRSRSFSLGMTGGLKPADGNVFASFGTHLRHDQKRRGRPYRGHLPYAVGVSARRKRRRGACWSVGRHENLGRRYSLARGQPRQVTAGLEASCQREESSADQPSQVLAGAEERGGSNDAAASGSAFQERELVVRASNDAGVRHRWVASR